MVRKSLLVIALSAMLCSSAARAADVYVRSITMPYYFQEFRLNEGTDRLPIYQFLSTSLADFGARGLSIHASGWGRLETMDRPEMEPWQQDAAEDEDEPMGDGDLTYGYVRWDGPDNVFTLQAGRMLMGPSLLLESVDGGSFVGRFPVGLNMTWYGGSPAVSTIGDREGDWLFGGRIDYALEPFIELGASYTKKIEEREVDNELAGLELATTPLPWFASSGHVYFDTRMNQVYDTQGMAVFRPLGGSKIILFYERVIPAVLLGKTSLFSVFTVDAYHHGQVAATFVILTHVELRAEYGLVAFEDEALGDPGHRAGGGFALIYGKGLANSVGINYVYLNEPDRGYNQGRVYLRQGMGKRVFGVADVTGTLLDNEIYGDDQSIAGSASLGVDITKYFQILGSASYTQSPFYDDDLRGLIKLAFNVDRTFWSSGR